MVWLQVIEGTKDLMDKDNHPKASRRLDKYSLHTPDTVSAMALLSTWRPHVTVE